jgi:uncharacterized protein YndB with AHSA1/START domain
MINSKTSVRVAAPIDAVFAYVSDPLRFPVWNSAVRAVRQVGATYVMERDLPTGRAVNELEIVTLEAPEEFAIRTITGPTPFLYRYRFSAEAEATLLDFEAEIQLPRIAGPAIKRGIEANLATLVRQFGR